LSGVDRRGTLEGLLNPEAPRRVSGDESVSAIPRHRRSYTDITDTRRPSPGALMPEKVKWKELRMRRN
jgi:hypothetical protein